MTNLTAKKVEEILVDCLFKEEEETDDAIIVEGIIQSYGLHPGRLESHHEEIVALLNELPDEFKASSVGKGWSFLAACYDRHGNLWGQHPDMERLFVLGLAIQYVKLLMTRDFWSALPGGMPYYQIHDESWEWSTSE